VTSKSDINEKHSRSLIKSIIWRILGVITLALVTFIFTRSWVQTGLITLFHHLSFIIIYYLHERLWIKIGDRIQGKTREILRVFLYEIVLGHCVLGLISLIVTSSWTKVTLVSIIYIETRVICYIVYDWLWSKIKWGLK